MTSVLPMQCFACTRLHASHDPDTGTQRAGTCQAFPGGIPRVMALGGDHRRPLPDDGGLRFVQAEGQQAATAFTFWQHTFEAPPI